MNYSPLRYPGGKTKLLPLIEFLIKKIDKKVTYIEPFVGGAGVALGLLFNNTVNNIVINDYDKAIYSFWRAVLTETNKFINLINNTEISIEEWKKQQNIYKNNNKKYSLELGFATFYLNRTNRSGILKAGPIGGYNQEGNYLIDARFNKDDLIKKIKKIASFKSKIKLYNKDINLFIKLIIPKYKNHFIYFDPPYFKKGEELYKNFFTANDHKKLGNKIKLVDDYWIVTYDDEPEIRKIYNNYNIKEFYINHSVANLGIAKEIIFVSNDIIWPIKNEIKKIKMPIIFKEYK